MLFDPFPKEKLFQSLMRKARKHNDEFDAIDGGKLNKSGVTERLRTAMTAIAAGVIKADMNCICEGLCILQDIEASIRGK